MSRASSIWLVKEPSGEVVAAFSVRHELVSWLKRIERDEGILAVSWQIEQRKDGPWGLHYDDSDGFGYLKNNWMKKVPVESLL